MKVSPLCYVSCLACLIASASIRAAVCAGVSPSCSRPCTASALRLSRIRSPSGSASGATRRASAALTMYRLRLSPAAAAAPRSCSACSGVTRSVSVHCLARYRAVALRCASVVLMPYHLQVYDTLYGGYMQAYNMHICKHISLCTLPIAYDSIYVLSYSHSKRHRAASRRARRTT